MRRTLALTSLALIAALTPGAAAGQSLLLQLHEGLVTLDAKDVSIRQILDEWARVGGVTLVNADALASTPTSIVLNGVPEREALATLLRETHGYMLGERRSGVGTGPNSSVAGPEATFCRLLPSARIAQASYLPPRFE